MRLNLLRSSSQTSSPGGVDQPCRRTTTTANQRRPYNALQRILTRCTFKCLRCQGDTISLTSELPYHSLRDTPMYLPQQNMGGRLQDITMDEDGRVSNQHPAVDEAEYDITDDDPDTDLSLFSERWNYPQPDRHYARNGNQTDNTDIPACSSSHHPTSVTSQSQIPKRIHTNFIPLAFNSHRSWLSRIDLGSCSSSTDDLSQLLNERDTSECHDRDHSTEHVGATGSGTDDTEDYDSDGEEIEWEDFNYISHRFRLSQSPVLSERNSNSPIQFENITALQWSSNSENDSNIDNYETLPPFDYMPWRSHIESESFTNFSNDFATQQNLNNQERHASRSTEMVPHTDQSNAQNYGESENTHVVPEGDNNTPDSTQLTSQDPESNSQRIMHSVENEASAEATVLQMADMPQSLRFLFQPHSETLDDSSHVSDNNSDSTTICPSTVPLYQSQRGSLSGYGPQIRQVGVPSATSSSSSERSSLHNFQQNMYIYDPRLNPFNRQERLNIQTQWCGVETAISMPAMIGPPDYEDLSTINGDNAPLPISVTEPPPPYADDQELVLPPPPTYHEALVQSLMENNTEALDSTATREDNITSGRALIGQGCLSLVQNINYNNISEDRNNTVGQRGEIENEDENGEDDLDINVLFNANITAQQDTLQADPVPDYPSPNGELITSPERGQGQAAATLETPESTGQALQAGFLSPRGRPATAWNFQRWGERGNQATFGINCRLLQSVNIHRF